MYPIVMISGKAGVGKDTAANIIAETYNARCIALADPIKRFARKVFGFTDEQCWGASQYRATPLEVKSTTKSDLVHLCSDIKKVFEYNAGNFLDELELNHTYLNSLRMVCYDFAHMVTDNKEFSLRDVLLAIGTEWGRQCNPDIWINCGIKTAKSLLGGGYIYDKVRGLVKDDKAYSNMVVITDGRFRNEILRVKEISGKVIHIERKTDYNVKHTSDTLQDTIPWYFFDKNILNNKEIGDLNYELRTFINQALKGSKND